ncbi:MAG: tetratricopeptide repeat protein [Pseudomonadota bacterium]
MILQTNRPSFDRKRALATMLAGAIVLTPASFASAAGGGGGGGSVGGSSSPSASAQRYDPAEEYRIGLAALNAEEFDKAAKHFKRVTRVARRNADAQYLLGVSYLRGGKAKKARKPLENAVKYDPDMILAHRDLAIAYTQLDRMTDAEAILGRLGERSAQCGAACAEKSSLDQAISAIEGALAGGAQAAIGPDISLLADAASADALYYQAVGLINDGDYEAALRRLDRAALAFGPHPDILTYQGFANRKLARFGTAEAYYNRALSVAPDHLGALEYYGELKVERGDLDGAKAHLARLDQLCSFGCYEAEELRSWIDNAAT